MHTHMHRERHTHAHAHTHMHTYKHSCTHTNTHTSAHTYKHTCTHMHPHTSAHTQRHTHAPQIKTKNRQPLTSEFIQSLGLFAMTEVWATAEITAQQGDDTHSGLEESSQ